MKITSKSVKVILAVFFILNLVIGILGLNQFRSKESFTKEIILKYISNQANIIDHLHNSIKANNQRDVLLQLINAKANIHENKSFLSDMGLGEKSGLYEIEGAYHLNRRGEILISSAISSAINGSLTQENINDIEAYISTLESYVEELDINYDSIRKQGSRFLLNKVADAISRIQN